MSRNVFFYRILILLFITYSSYTFGQGNYGKVTSQTSDFIKYGITPVSLFTGKVTLEVPIYTIKDPDFTFPIKICYSSDGFKPSKHSGYMGLN